MYEELETFIGEKIYSITKNRNKASKDVHHVKQMKDLNGVVLRDEKKRCKRDERNTLGSIE